MAEIYTKIRHRDNLDNDDENFENLSLTLHMPLHIQLKRITVINKRNDSNLSKTKSNRNDSAHAITEIMRVN